MLTTFNSIKNIRGLINYIILVDCYLTEHPNFICIPLFMNPSCI